MTGLDSRQEAIITILQERRELEITELEQALAQKTSRSTLNRALADLVARGFLSREGKGKATTYKLSPTYSLLAPVLIDKYFALGPDWRQAKEAFNHSLIPTLESCGADSLFTEAELNHVHDLHNRFRNNIAGLTPVIKRKEFERLTIELAWKSSAIEGNTYSLIETETLLTAGVEAEGHRREEAIMLLNHKAALEYIVQKPEHFQEITIAKIKELHSLLAGGLNIPSQIRTIPVGISGTKYLPLDNQFQIEELLEKVCVILNQAQEPVAKALIASALIAYIQPFADGNKRTSRISANAILMAYGYCPLSYRSVQDTDYKMGLLLFYEQNNISHHKKIFLEQFEFAIKTYWRL